MSKVDIKKFAQMAKDAASESIVLLENVDNTLPLKDEKISFFGRPIFDYYRSGTGSGGAVNVPYAIGIIEGLEAGSINYNKDIIEDYKEWLKDHPFDNGGGGWAAEPWHQVDMEITADYAKAQAEKSDKAVYIIGRTAGEDKDNYAGEGSYYLTENEKTNIQNICAAFDDVIILLNTAGIMDMKWLEEDGIKESIKAVAYVWQGGLEGGNSVMDFLSGKVNPSGKMPDTVAYTIEDYPSTKNFGDKYNNYYAEDIYVGYRYFETFKPEAVQYAFGYGMSYTSFDIKTTEASEASEVITLKVDVTNTGAVAGKEVVQVYLSAPQGELGKPAKQLVGYEKTKELAAGETQTLTIELNVADFASYDDSGVTGHKSCYVLEAGEYKILVGNSVRNNEAVFSYNLADTVVVEELSEAMCPDDDKLEILKPGKLNGDVFEETYVPSQHPTVDLAKRIEDNLPETMEITGDVGIKLQDVIDGKNTMDEFVAQLSVDEMAQLLRGEGMSNPRVTPGTASAFGGLSDSLFKLGIPVACCADGPSGLRMLDETVQLPIGTSLAATWNDKLVRELYTMEGKEIAANLVDTLLGPGVNIHRNPLNGRNFEYYSEDPILTGRMAVATTGGIKDGGSWGTIKHFALNNQEFSRFKINAVCSERAIREIYLKPFEMAVKENTVATIMTSYNPINGHWAASNYDLCTTILRGEWGYTGMVMTDWWAKMNDVVEGGEESDTDTRDLVRSQNDVYMIVNNNGAEVNSKGDNTVESVEQGRLTIGELQRTAKNILNFIINAVVIQRELVDTDVPLDCPVDENATAKYRVVKAAGDNQMDINSEKNVTMEVEEEGDYTVIANLSFEKGNLFQSTVNVNSDKGNMFVLQTNGTDGNWITMKLCKLHLYKGLYNLDLEDVQEGIKVSWLQMKKNK